MLGVISSKNILLSADWLYVFWAISFKALKFFNVSTQRHIVIEYEGFEGKFPDLSHISNTFQTVVGKGEAGFVVGLFQHTPSFA